MADLPEYTHGHHDSVLRSHRWRTASNSAAYLLPQLRPGLSVLDVGSGPGTITADLARLVAPGRVTAVEQTPQALALTQAEIERQGIDTVDFTVGDAHGLPFPDASFDVVHAHQVLQHVAEPAAVLREMRRVCTPGGVVAARDGDYSGFVWYPLLPELDEWLRLYCAVARSDGGEPDAGRRLLSWAQQAGFRDVVATSSTWCFSTPDSRSWWGGMWADRIRESRVAASAVERGLATPADLERISRAWLEWASTDDAWISILHGEILARP